MLSILSKNEFIKNENNNKIKGAGRRAQAVRMDSFGRSQNSAG